MLPNKVPPIDGEKKWNGMEFRTQRDQPQTSLGQLVGEKTTDCLRIGYGFINPTDWALEKVE